MPIEPLDTNAKTYLAAIGASAIYVSLDQGKTITVGVSRDLDKVLGRLRRIYSPTLVLGWCAWSAQYDGLVDLSRMPDLLYGETNGVKTALPLDHLVRRIELTARESGITLTPHGRALERSRVYAGALDEAIAAMQQAGVFKTFNQAYRMNRLQLARKGESAAPYWAVMGVLRSIIVRLLVANQFSTDAALEEIRKRFPWFTRYRKNGRSVKYQQRR